MLSRRAKLLFSIRVPFIISPLEFLAYFNLHFVLILLFAHCIRLTRGHPETKLANSAGTNRIRWVLDTVLSLLTSTATQRARAITNPVSSGNMNQLLKSRLLRSFQLTHDLVAHLEETSLNLDLPNLPSNRISGQLWCVVGARESYTKAIEAGGWQGFSCSLKTSKVKQSVLEALEATHKRLNEVDVVGLGEAQLELAFALLEHEVQHHGQLIRFVYGNGLSFPASWNKQYTV